MVKLLLTSVFNLHNKGEIMQVEGLTRSLPGADFLVLGLFSYLPPALVYRYGLQVVGRHKPYFIPVFFIWFMLLLLRAALWRVLGLQFLLNSMLKKVLACDLAVDLGGDTFADKPHLFYSLSHIGVLILMRLLKLPYAVVSQTIGPFNNPFTRLAARSVLKKAVVVTVRDRTSLSYLQTLGLKHVHIAPDIGFLSGRAQPRRARARAWAGPIVGINISPIVCRSDFDVRLFSALIDQIVESLNCFIILLPHVTGPRKRHVLMPLRDDRIVMAKIHGLLSRRTRNRTYLLTTADLHGIRTCISECDVFVGARMHAVIYAVKMGVPSILLAYSGKAHGLADLLGLKDYVFSKTESQDMILKIARMLKDHMGERWFFRMAGQTAEKMAEYHVKMLQGSFT